MISIGLHNILIWIICSTLLHSVTHTLIECALWEALAHVESRRWIRRDICWAHSCSVRLTQWVERWLRLQEAYGILPGETVRGNGLVLFLDHTILRGIDLRLPLLNICIHLHYCLWGVHFSIAWLKLRANVRTRHRDRWPLPMVPTVLAHETYLELLNRLFWHWIIDTFPRILCLLVTLCCCNRHLLVCLWHR